MVESTAMAARVVENKTGVEKVEKAAENTAVVKWVEKAAENTAEVERVAGALSLRPNRRRAWQWWITVNL